MQERIKKLEDQRNWSPAVIAVAQVSSRRKSNASIHAEQIIINHVDIFWIIVLVVASYFLEAKHSDLTKCLFKKIRKSKKLYDKQKENKKKKNTKKKKKIKEKTNEKKRNKSSFLCLTRDL